MVLRRCVGIVLITVSGIAWRLTSHDAPSCRAMLGLQNSEQEPNRRFVPRVPPYGRPHHPYAAMMYPEFQYRPPPPSYQASMQEYRLRLLLLDRQQGSGATSNTASALSPVSPPPTYRSHNTGTLHSSEFKHSYVIGNTNHTGKFRKATFTKIFFETPLLSIDPQCAVGAADKQRNFFFCSIADSPRILLSNEGYV
ncbi:uncharacterized protein TNCV_2479281 [Trichonephila clavipes]|nr:uncharacterized protein TNCV_2479281 [Trichonephila clavipes]